MKKGEIIGQPVYLGSKVWIECISADKLDEAIRRRHLRGKCPGYTLCVHVTYADYAYITPTLVQNGQTINT